MVSGVSILRSVRTGQALRGGPENNTTLEMSLFPMEVPRSSIFRINIAHSDLLVMVRTRLR